MTDYGKAIVEAAARAGATAFWRQTYKDADGMVMVAAGTTWRETEHLYRAALIAAIDRLIEAGPSNKMLDAAGFVRGINWRFDIYRRDAKATFVVLLRALRDEIED